ncbi:hypothetical protein TGME49_202060 [Toxoplasma gondii ME49]|uniref:Uncharacterized protein n=1 Tax=Toxoplasma gondii (strain ATCC 50611 / Me49) TaxID=508771 RepID=S8F695_TOXGM|nr:hypothetical protein TGME49_202060 [Toxoplasma gondii ME49]EPT30262.1 hypothetical protein TGME49_202060 [Toxoplasma gondii ME49]|eukprot:XP_018637423.1 hypothetical protein TGME49_202060 [Toxoplasma gondii ME49]
MQITWKPNLATVVTTSSPRNDTRSAWRKLRLGTVQDCLDVLPSLLELGLDATFGGVEGFPRSSVIEFSLYGLPPYEIEVLADHLLHVFGTICTFFL